jgi:hypothetical protein
MATDYDAPRKSEEDLSEDSIEELKTRRVEKPTAGWTSESLRASRSGLSARS